MDQTVHKTVKIRVQVPEHQSRVDPNQSLGAYEKHYIHVFWHKCQNKPCKHGILWEKKQADQWLLGYKFD